MTLKQLILPIFLITSLHFAISLNNEGECVEKDFQAFAHCISKRSADIWCSSQSCRRCEEGICQTTCKGFYCGLCPDGNCCDSKNCNACHGNLCCSTAPCNYCIRTCRNACNNSTDCVNYCVPQCQNGPHDVFVVPTAENNSPKVIVYIKGVPYNGNITSGQFPISNKEAIVSIDGKDQPATVLILSPISQRPCQTPSCNNASCLTNSCKQCSTNSNCNNCLQKCGSTCTNGRCYNSCSNNCLNQQGNNMI